ncbi:hypothetical protein QE152_g27351 [Popillia japonica]|uniref:Uncharacterized protein n=1 Tax=Popillia japonica TaxID=7064 RepID=A0AAW1JVE2_POPJA
MLNNKAEGAGPSQSNSQTAESRTLSYQIEEAPASHSNNEPKEKTTPPHQIISPDVLRPYPKGNLKNTNRKKGKKTTEILTSTPVFKDIEEQELAKERRTQSIRKILTSTPVFKDIEEQELAKERRTQSIRKVKTSIRNKICPLVSEQENINPKMPASSSSDSESSLESLSLVDSGEVDIVGEPLDINEPTEITVGTFILVKFPTKPLDINEPTEITVGTFILVKFPTKKQIKFCAGRVTQADFVNKEYFTTFCAGRVTQADFVNKEYFTTFLRKRRANKFSFPDVPDESVVTDEDVVMILPSPVSAGGTARVQRHFQFSVDLSRFNLY